MTVATQIELAPSPVNALERRYRAWRASPAGQQLYPMFRVFAWDMLRARRPFGVKALAERVRWEVSLKHPLAAHELKVNNSYVAYIARDLVRETPQLESLIEFRRVRA